MNLLMKKRILILNIVLFGMSLIFSREKILTNIHQTIIIRSQSDVNEIQEILSVRNHINSLIKKKYLIEVRKKTERKKRNKLIHSLNGNRKLFNRQIADNQDNVYVLEGQTGHSQLRLKGVHLLKIFSWLKFFETGQGQLRQIFSDLLQMPLWAIYGEIGHSKSNQWSGYLNKTISWCVYVMTGHSQLILKARHYLQMPSWANYVEIGHSQSNQWFGFIIKTISWYIYVVTGHSQLIPKAGHFLKMLSWDNTVETGHGRLRQNSLNKKTVRKRRNKLIHSLNGNRKLSSLKFAFWNDKISYSHRASSTRDNLSLILKEKNIEIICISEANIMKDDEAAEVNITGFDLLSDNLLRRFGRARSSIYVRDNIKYKMRNDLMSNDEPEVWIEIEGSKHFDPILIV